MVNQLLDNMDLEMQDQMVEENLIFGGNARWNGDGVINRRRVKYIARVVALRKYFLLSIYAAIKTIIV